MKKLILTFLPLIDLLLLPFVYSSAFLLKIVRQLNIKRLPLSKNALFNVGIYPIQDHYYEPQFNFNQLTKPLSAERNLPGINWNNSMQLNFLSKLTFAEELLDLPYKKTGELIYYFNNGTFESGDAEYWYQVIRAVKPTRIFEVGSGNSTLIAIRAINENRKKDAAYSCKHVCVEPFEHSWLKSTGVDLIRRRVEDLEVSFFAELKENDILFIDSSHVIRPQGDILYEYLELFPLLKSGVIVHIHDIFSPRNYPKEWLFNDIRLWNEQYILEGFLTHNKEWEIIGALNYLKHHYFKKLKVVAPYLTVEREPGSFYLRKL